ncbi:sulfurtransferase [Neptunitalea chrysea]|uniref:Sulfurtransferase n=1 Tax=Neptunitalea chrysea TaxID=1647581 RepID=A0A9W6ETT5_9FLAO|nr:sulfurtransferase [Neptunitalea chrysea]GLB52520.1 sulfurtransferase [Neptunitalea chrysea]
MKSNLSPIITGTSLRSVLNSSSVIIIDAGSSPKAQENYQKNHISGAFYIDLNTQLSNIKEDAAKGGRHPLPSPEAFATVLETYGITPNSHIVIYDMFYGANAAARLWWMLTAIGHQKVQVLSGGLEAAEKAGISIDANNVPTPEKGYYTATTWALPTATIDEVASTVNLENGLVIDVRDTPRYNGKTEPIDLIAGHIPGAVNIPFKENLTEEFLFKSPEELHQKYTTAFEGKATEHIIIHCGSGVTACHTLLATAYAGLPIPKLYVGSWSEWSRNNRPIATLQVPK